MTTIDDQESEFHAQTFTDGDFSGREFVKKEFDSCIFERCDFTAAVFNQCRFVDCSFIACNLSVVKVPLCRFADVEFYESKLIGIDWSKANWSSLVLQAPLKMSRCNVSDSSFFGLSLKELLLEDCKAHDVDFRNANLSDGKFCGTDFSGSVFGRTRLAGADFSDAHDYTIDVLDNELRGAQFSRFAALSLLDGLGIELVD